MAFGAGRLGTSEVAAGLASLHGPYIAWMLSPDLQQRFHCTAKSPEEARSAVMKTASESAAGDSGHHPRVARVMRFDAGTDISALSRLSLSKVYTAALVKV